MIVLCVCVCVCVCVSASLFVCLSMVSNKMVVESLFSSSFCRAVMGGEKKHRRAGMFGEMGIASCKSVGKKLQILCGERRELSFFASSSPSSSTAASAYSRKHRQRDSARRMLRSFLTIHFSFIQRKRKAP